MSSADAIADGIDYAASSTRVAAAAAAIIAHCEEVADGATVIGLALCPDEDLRSMFWVANTTEAVGDDPCCEFEFADWPLSDDEIGPVAGFDGSLGL